MILISNFLVLEFYSLKMIKTCLFLMIQNENKPQHCKLDFYLPTGKTRLISRPDTGAETNDQNVHKI